MFGVPDGPGIGATFGPVITASRTIDVDDDFTVGSVVFNSPISYTLNGDGYLALRSAVGETSSINVQAGHHSILRPLSLGNTVIDVAPDAQLNVGTMFGAGSLTKIGGGTLKANGTHHYSGTTTVSGGTFILSGNHSGLGTFTITNGGALAGAGAVANVRVEPGGKFSPGENADTRAIFTVNTLSLDDSILFFDITSTGADKLVVKNSNALLLDGVSMINIGGDLRPGAYTLIDYSGTPLTDIGQLILGDHPHVGLSLLLAYHAENTSIVLAVGTASSPEPTSILTVLSLLWLPLARRRRA
jgi:autotransporter-associated beta strand protein